MPDMTTLPTTELATLQERVKRLANDKSHLQLIIRLMNRLSAGPGLDATVQNMLSSIADVIGGANVSLYYVIDNVVYYADVYGEQRQLDSVTDSLVNRVMETHEPIEHEHEFGDTRMLTPEFSKAYTWIVPLLVSSDLVGVFKMESLHIAMRELHQQLPTFFAYAALVLKNEIQGHTRLKLAYDDLAREVGVRKQAEENLRLANDVLEARVAERTAELQNANARLKENEQQITALLEKSETSRRALEMMLEDEKRLETALRLERALLSRIMETSPVGITLVNRDGQVTFANSQSEKVLGLTKGTITQLTYNAPDWRITGYDGGPFPDEELPFRRVLSTRQPVYDVQHAIVWPDGRRVLLSINGAPLLNEAGEVDSVVCTIEDVTERKRAEETLRRLNRELHAVSNCNQVLMRAVDEQTLLKDICRIVCDEAGYRMAWVGRAEHDDARTVRPVAWAGVEEGYLATANITWADTERGRGPSGRAIRSGETHCIQDFATDPLAAPWRENALQRGYRSSIALPLKDDSATTFGVLTIYSTEPNAFVPDEIRLLEELAGDLAFGITVMRNRAERKRNERELIILNRAISQSSDAVFLINEQLRFAYVNDAACRSLDYTREELLSMGPSDIDAVITYESAQEIMHRQFADNHFPRFETRHKTRDGRIFPVEISSSIVEYDGAKFSLTTVRDITERQQAEQRIGRLAAIVESSEDAIISKTPEGIITSWNKGAETIYGYAESEVIGKSITLVVPPGNEAEVFQMLDRIRAGEHVAHHETVRRRKDGQLIHMSLAISPIRDSSGRVIAASTIGRDITRRKRTEEALHESEEKYRTLIQKIQAAVVVHGPDTRILICNPRAQELLGLTEDQMLGTTSVDQHWHFLRDDGTPMPEADYPVNQVLATRQPLRDVVIGLPDASLRRAASWALVKADPVWDRAGEIAQVIVTFIDITARKQAEEALQAREKHSQSLLRLSRNLERAQTYGQVLNAALDEVKTAIGYQNLWVYLLTDDRQAFKALVAGGQISGTVMSEEGTATLKIEGDRMLEEIAAAREIVVVEDARTDERTNKEIVARLANRTIVNVPILLFERHLGAVGMGTFGTEGVRVPTPLERDYLIAMASHMAVSLDRIHLLDRRARAEEELRASEERYRLLHENTGVGIGYYTPAGEVISYNRLAASHMGGQLEDFQGKSMYDIFPKPEADFYMDRLRQCLAVDSTLEFEDHVKLPVGEKWFLSVFSKICGLQNQVLGVQIISQDITVRKQMEEELRSAGSYARSLIEASLDPLVTISPAGKITDVNRATEEVTGVPREQLIGDDFSDYFTEPDRAREGYQTVLAAGLVRDFPLTIRHVSGRTTDVLYNATVYKNQAGELQGVFAAARDITRSKQAEAALRESEERLRQIASSLREVIWLRDAQTRRVLYVNPAFEELTGRTCKSFYENQDIVIESVHPDDREQVTTALEQRSENIPFDREHRLVHLDGSVRWVSARSFPVRNEAGEVYRWASTMEDITERKRAEEEIQKLNQELEQRVLDRTAQLETTNKELEAFAYSVSHDLRAPLRHIDGFLELLQTRLTTTLDEQNQHYMDTISESAKRMGVLIDDLLSFSRMGRHDLARQAVDLNSLVREVIRDFEPETRGRTIQWRIANLPVVTGDRAMLRVVLSNLISNALKFTRSRAQADIEIGYEAGATTGRVFFIRDNGVGFDMAYVDKLFGVFQRLHRADEFEGTGIGLANVRRIISRHGGRTWAQGQVNHGATFYFSLPQLTPEN